ERAQQRRSVQLPDVLSGYHEDPATPLGKVLAHLGQRAALHHDGTRLLCGLHQEGRHTFVVPWGGLFRPFWIGLAFILAAAPALKEASPATALWAAPSILLAALLIAWAAESAQFFIAQGFALAILAWMQTMPEFAMEAVFAWRQQIPYLFASLTGALRLLTGLGWPMIYFTAAVFHRRRRKSPLRRILLEGEHSVQVVGLLIPLIYITVVVLKGSLHLVDAVILT